MRGDVVVMATGRAPRSDGLGLEEVGVSLGIQPDEAATVEIVRRHVEQGYRRIKLKVKPGWDTWLPDQARPGWCSRSSGSVPPTV